MPTLRQRINGVKRLTKTERMLHDAEVITKNGNLTQLGMRILADIVYKEYKDEVAAAVQAVQE